MAKKRKTLGSATRFHQDRAEAALSQSERFMSAAKKQADKGLCDVALRSIMTARSFAAIATSEAAHARKKGGPIGPTRIQTKASRNEDTAINLGERIVMRCAR